jgi:hypothetical protein
MNSECKKGTTKLARIGVVTILEKVVDGTTSSLTAILSMVSLLKENKNFSIFSKLSASTNMNVKLISKESGSPKIALIGLSTMLKVPTTMIMPSSKTGLICTSRTLEEESLSGLAQRSVLLIRCITPFLELN